MPTLLFGVCAVPKMPVELTVGVALVVLLGLLTVAPAVVELLVMVPVVPPSDPLELVAELDEKLPIPVVLVVDGAVTALDVIEAAVGRVSVVDIPEPPPPPELALVVELELDVGAVMTPAALTLALGEVT
jgi:hypothetical protein